MSTRISVGNLVVRLRVDSTGEIYLFGILSAADYNLGKRAVIALGGAATLTPEGRRLLEDRHSARDFRKDDARFITDVDPDTVLDLFLDRDSGICETTPDREVLEELSGPEIPGIPPPLEPHDLGGVRFEYVDTVKQRPPQSGSGTSTLEIQGTPTRRLFHRFEMVVDSTIFEKLRGSELITFLSPEEVATTNGGSTKGKTRGGVEIKDNIF